METAYAMDLEPFISVQPEYSMLRRAAESEMVPCCDAYALGILPYFPLAQGFLTGKFKRGAATLEGTRLADSSSTADTFLTDANFDTLERLEAFAQARGHSVLEVAFAWLLANPLVGSVIAGATKTWQVESNVKAADWQLDPNDLLEVNAILDGAD
jgi:aryl-alcohol dehydrogenase-like predicted oxidoreductase